MARAHRTTAVAIVAVVVAWSVAGRQAARRAVIAGVDGALRRRCRDQAVVLRDQAANLQIAHSRSPHRSGREAKSDGAAIDAANPPDLGCVGPLIAPPQPSA